MQDTWQAALDNCDKEPIHIPGAIQSHGCLIAFEKGIGGIAAISANAGSFLGIEPEDALGKPLSELFEREILHAIGNKLGYSTITSRREFVGTIDRKRRSKGPAELELFVHAGPDFHYLEIVEALQPNRDLQDRIAGFTGGVQSCRNIDDVLDYATKHVKAVCCYDRVMSYRFLPDGSGEVVAEACSAHMEQFLGLRYPAWDIPKQARALYASMPIRAIADVHEDAVPLIAAPSFSASDFDLSSAVLRATSPVHLEYLANMGVASTMTIPIVVEGELWGLITCHNDTKSVPRMDLLDAGEIIGRVVSFMIAQLLQRQESDLAFAAVEIRDRFIALQTQLEKPAQFAEALKKAVQGKVDIDGLALKTGDDWHTLGEAPESYQPIMEGAFEVPSEFGNLIASSDASEALAKSGSGALAGFLEIPVLTRPDTRFILYRRPVRTEVVWGGHPKKDIEEAETNPRLSPRKSFAKYIDEKGDQSEEWTTSDVQFALSLQRECASSQSTAGTIIRQKDHLRVLADELDHRVKNILALVRSLSANTRDRASSPQDYAESLEARLVSLAASHDMLTRSDMQGVKLRDVVEMELEPFLPAEDISASLSGPNIVLSPDALPMATLLMHELATNAAKHGALSVSNGSVRVEWGLNGEELTIDWAETGGPPVKEPSRKGFGMELLREAIPFEFGGKAQVQFAPTGFHATYSIPSSRILSHIAVPSSDVIDDGNEAPKQSIKQLRRALVVEDSYLLAREHARALEELGFSEVDIASNVVSAFSCMREAKPDFALLDINLRDEVSFAIADELANEGVRFAFVTGYGSQLEVPEKFADIVRIRKPLERAALTAALA